MKLFLTLFITLFLTGFATAQSSGQSTQERSLADLAANEKFSSAKGGFSIDLPNATGTPASKKEQGADVSGETFMWFFKEGIIILTYYDFTDPKFSLKTDKDYADFFESHKDDALKHSGAKLISEGPLKLGEYTGYGISFQMPSGSTGIARNYYAHRKEFTLIAFITMDMPGAEALIAKAFDSFSPLPQDRR